MHSDECFFLEEMGRFLIKQAGAPLFQTSINSYNLEVINPMGNSSFSPVELGAYHLGVTSEKQTKDIKRYLAAHPEKANEFELLENYLQMMEDELPLDETEVTTTSSSIWQQATKQVRILVANLVPEPTLAFALLGEGGNESRVYEAENVQIFVQIQDDEDLPEHHTMLGMVAGIEPSDMKVHLWETEQPDKIASAQVDASGNFLIPQLASATYELILSNGETEIHIPGIVT